MSFAEFWSRYPRKVAKKAAEKAYLRVSKTIPEAAIMASLDLMLETDWRHRKPEYLPHASTYLLREDFEDMRCEAIEDEEPRAGDHLCDCCTYQHLWHEDGDPLNWSVQWRLACPEARQKMRETIASGLQRAAALKSF